ncbi:MAG: hypothetical protein ACRCXB_12260 [Aeromonadaceae bacterium]
MNDKQQLAAMGEHMREMEGCKPELKVPEGWKLVPVEPTCYQVLVGRNADSMDDEPCVAVYLAMLAAAPEYKP